MNKFKSTEYFIKKAKAMHHDYFDYSKVLYTGANKKVQIICPVHGLFEQTAAKHLNGNGCNQCRKEGIRSNVVPKIKPKLFL